MESKTVRRRLLARSRPHQPTYCPPSGCQVPKDHGQLRREPGGGRRLAGGGVDEPDPPRARSSSQRYATRSPSGDMSACANTSRVADLAVCCR